MIEHKDGRILFQQYGSSNIDLITDYKVPLDQQVHIAATRDASSGVVRIYVDGDLSAESTVDSNITPHSSNGPLRIGFVEDFPSFNGDIKDVSVWNVARSQSDIQSNHIVGNESGLVAYYPVLSASGNTLENQSSVSGLTASLIGDAQKVSVPIPIAYTLTSGDVEVDSSTQFSVTLNPTDQLNVGGLLNKNGTSSDGGTTYNLAAADDWVVGAAASADVSDASNTGITVSNVANPTLSSAVYDAASGVLALTGTNFVKENGANNDVDVSKLSITGEGGSSYTLTSADVEVSSSTQFNVTLNAADQLNVGGLLNKNGTSSDGGTTYNLAAADDWVAGAAASVDISDSSSNGITVLNVPLPTISGLTYNATTGALTVSGANFVKKNGSNNDVNVSKLSITGEGGSSYRLTSADVEVSSSTQFTVNLNTADQLNVGGLLNKNETRSDGGVIYTFAADDDWLAGAAPSADISVSTGFPLAALELDGTNDYVSVPSSSALILVPLTRLLLRHGSTQTAQVILNKIFLVRGMTKLVWLSDGDFIPMEDSLCGIIIIISTWTVLLMITGTNGLTWQPVLTDLLFECMLMGPNYLMAHGNLTKLRHRLALN